MNDADTLFTRNIMCAMIQRAVEDLKNETTYGKTNAQSHADQNRRSAKYFLQSDFFNSLCETLGLPACKIKREALK